MTQRRITKLLAMVVVIILASCGAQKGLSKNSAISSLRFLHQYAIPYNFNFQGTIVGGLSGIDYNPAKEEFYMICDDGSERSPARFYTARIHINDEKIDTLIFTGVTFLKMRNGNVYPNAKQDPQSDPDPEALRHNAKNGTLVWSSEGTRIVNKDKTILNNPSVTVIRPNGKYIDTFALPNNMRMTSAEKGPRRNSAFEGISFDDQHNNLFVSVEEPIYDDGNRATISDTATWTRIIKFDAVKHTPIAQYAYPLERLAHPPYPAGTFGINGVTDILFIESDKFITVERSFSTGRLDCTIKVFLTDISNASDVTSVALKNKPNFRPVNKRLLLNMDSLGIFIDNVEGVTFGPTLPNGHRTLLFIADNNFAAYQLSQLLLFEVIP